MITVVIPLYNKEEHVERALISVLTQSYQNLRIIVVDDGSTDAGAARVMGMVEKDDRVQLIRQSNAGVSAARNRGVAAATTELIAFLDADDAYAPSFLADVVKLAEKHPQPVAYAFNYEIILPSGEHRLGVDNQRACNGAMGLLEFLKIGVHGSPVFSSTVVVRRSALLEAGGFPIGVRLGEDIDTWLRLLFHGEVWFDGRVGGFYCHDATNRALVHHMPPRHYRFFDTLDEWCESHPDRLEEKVASEEFKNFFRLIHAHYQIRWGDRREGLRVLQKCRTRTFRIERLRLLVLGRLPSSWYACLADWKRKVRFQ